MNTVDTLSPNILNCPSDIHTVVEVGTSETPVVWYEPSAFDASGTIDPQASHRPGLDFNVGVTDVSYAFTDHFGNTAFCNFSVLVDQGKAHLVLMGTHSCLDVNCGCFGLPNISSTFAYNRAARCMFCMIRVQTTGIPR